VTTARCYETIRGFVGDLVALRRDLHRHPEVGFEEVRTAGRVARELRALGLEVAEGIARTGVVGTLRGERAGSRAIGLRADMDALHIQERSESSHASCIAGRMHACGHDGHTAMLLGAARYLARHPQFAGTVHFIFQPAEEGLAGARHMVEDGLFDRFPVDAVYGMHNQPGRAAGSFGICQGPMLAASDRWSVTIKGSGGHGGHHVHRITDPSIPLGQFVVGLQSVVSRRVPANEAAVVSIGSISGGDPLSPNIIPAEYVVRGTARSYSPTVRAVLEQSLRLLAEGTAAAHGCTAVIEYRHSYPAVVNAPGPTRIAIAAAAAVAGPEAVETAAEPSTASEDFSFLIQDRPGAFIWIGNGLAADGHGHGLHTASYDFNDEILAIGSSYWVEVVRQELGSANQDATDALAVVR
jgi:hippurate hydrolase